MIDPSGHDIVLFLDVDCLIMRNLDHLFVKDDWDILDQPEPGRSIKDPVFHGYLTDIEMASLGNLPEGYLEKESLIFEARKE